MSAAAYSSSVDRTSDWLAELEVALKRFEAIPSAAQDAVRSVVESLLNDPETTKGEIAYARALLANSDRRSEDTRHRREPSLLEQPIHYGFRVALTRPQSA